jgi:hypothetical protein
VCCVRAQGPVEDVPAAASGDHLCWIYEDDADLGAAAREFLTAGLDRGERLLCVGVPPDVPHLDELITRGAVESLDLDEVYAAGPFDPDRQLAYYDAATRGARDDGYSGLRVLADISDLATDDGQRAQLMRWEQLADGYAVHGAGFSAMCAYRADLPHEALADIAAVHPLVHGEPSAFRLFADQDGIALAGSVDTFCSDRLARALDAAPVAEGGVVLDLTRLEFLDIAACRTLARWAAGLAARSLDLEIAGSSHLFRRMWQLLDLELMAPVTYGSRPT